jgi:hypothetical protein
MNNADDKGADYMGTAKIRYWFVLSKDLAGNAVFNGYLDDLYWFPANDRKCMLNRWNGTNSLCMAAAKN